MGTAVPLRIGRHVHPDAARRPRRHPRRRPGSTTCDLIADRPPAASWPPTRINYDRLTAPTGDGTADPATDLTTERDAAAPRPTRPHRTARGRPRPTRQVGCHEHRQPWAPTTGSPAPRSARTSPPPCCTATRAHAEAVARIGWCITEQAIGVITGEVGAGKTVAVRAALAALDASRHTIIYLGNPAVGARGIYAGIVTALGGVPRFHNAALIPQTVDALAAEARRTRPRRRSWSSTRPTCSTPTNSRNSGCSPTPTWTPTPRSPACSSANPPCAARSNSAPSPPSTNASPCATP